MTPLGDDRLLDDSVLIARLSAQQDDAAFELLMARHRPQVARVCLAILKDRDDADGFTEARGLVSRFGLSESTSTALRFAAIRMWLYRSSIARLI